MLNSSLNKLDIQGDLRSSSGIIATMVLVLISLFLVIVIGYAISGFTGAPWVPTRVFDIEQLLKDTQLKKGDVFIELGCGDGRLLVRAAKLGAQAVGYEINPALWLIAWVRTARYAQIKVRFGSFWPVPISSASVVMVFLMPKFMGRLESKANRELRGGSRLVSYIFPLPKTKPTKRGKRWYVYEYK